jgi:hypothetical protein
MRRESISRKPSVSAWSRIGAGSSVRSRRRARSGITDEGFTRIQRIQRIQRMTPTATTQLMIARPGATTAPCPPSDPSNPVNP